MTKSCYAAFAVLFFILLTPVARAGEKQPQRRPNVLFIAIDDLNDWIGALGGHPQARTPHLDRLAKKGVLFTRAYCPAPSCNPSRAALLTGLRPSTTGVYFNDQPWRPAAPNAVTLLQYFRQHGYRVLGGGKIFHGAFNDAKSWDTYFQAKNKVGLKEGRGRGIGGNMTWGPLNAADADLADGVLTDWAIDRLKEKHDTPFFLSVGYVKPHLAWHAPKKYFDLHPLDQVQLPKVLENDLADVPPAGVKMAKPDTDHRKIVKAGQWKEAVQAYLACSSYMDAQLGRLLDALEQSPHARDTVIILWSDHGWHHGQKEHWRKFALWEQACRVVFTITAPGVTPVGQRCERPVNLMDIYPTAVALCGLPEKQGLEGNNLLPLLKNPQTAWEHPSLSTWGRNNHAVRSERWRYIRYQDGSEELYDHTADPLEWKNLAKDPQFAKVKEELATHFPKVNAPNAPGKKGAAGEVSWRGSPQAVFPVDDWVARADGLNEQASRLDGSRQLTR